MRDSGIFAIVNTENDKVYVSASIEMARRQAFYRHLLCDGVFFNASLQEAWQQFGESVFEFGVLEAVGPEGLAERKQHWIDFYRMRGGVYNSLSDGRHSEEMRRRTSEAVTGREVSEETRDKVAKSYPAFCNERTGEMIPAGHNLHALCKLHGLDDGQMSRLARGKVRQHKHWVLAEGMG